MRLRELEPLRLVHAAGACPCAGGRPCVGLGVIIQDTSWMDGRGVLVGHARSRLGKEWQGWETTTSLKCLEERDDAILPLLL
jgi:hypothetical protein